MTREIVVDGRWLEPPEPMGKVLAALERLAPGERIRFLLHREPFPLYPILTEMGLCHRVRPIAEGCFEILIEPRRGGPPG